MISEKARLARRESASVTATVRLNVPAAPGMPLIAPLAELSDSPAGNAPAVKDQA